MVAPASALARVPEELAAADAAPLMCAGVTTYNALRNSGARAGDLVAVHGLGGLGHLGVQYAAKMGFRTVAIARGTGQGAAGAEARRAPCTSTASAEDPGRGLAKLGGARVILATVTSGKAMSADDRRPGRPRHADGDRRAGASRCEIAPFSLLIRQPRRSAAGTRARSIDSEDTLAFSVLSGVRSMNEVFPLERAARSLRADDERQGPLPRGAEDGLIGRLPHRAKAFPPAPSDLASPPWKSIRVVGCWSVWRRW